MKYMYTVFQLYRDGISLRVYRWVAMKNGQWITCILPRINKILKKKKKKKISFLNFKNTRLLGFPQTVHIKNSTTIFLMFHDYLYFQISLLDLEETFHK